MFVSMFVCSIMLASHGSDDPLCAQQFVRLSRNTHTGKGPGRTRFPFIFKWANNRAIGLNNPPTVVCNLRRDEFSDHQ